MEHIAIDLGGRKSQICIRDAAGTILLEKSTETARLSRFFARSKPSRVILETCAEAFAIADSALEAGHEVRVVPATLVRTLGVGSRGVKTDIRDAQVLSEVSTRIDLPSVHIPKDVSREWKSICGMRQELIRCRTASINCVRGWLRRNLIKPKTGDTTTFAGRVREVTLNSKEGPPTHVERLLLTIEQVCESIKQADLEVKALAESDDTCVRLMSVPGVGPVTALRFVAALDEISRFSNAQSVGSYLGLAPGENSSSERVRRTGITKAGAVQVRVCLIQCAWLIRRFRKADPMAVWAEQIAARRGTHVATTALARKLSGILFAIWRDNSLYEPARSAS
jgi:transposase